MKLLKKSIVKNVLSFVLAGSVLISGSVGVFGDSSKNVQAEAVNAKNSLKFDKLNRGLVGAYTEQGVYLGWRLLINEATGNSETGLTGADFNVYRDGKMIATVKDSTNFLDKDGTKESKYYVVSVVDGKELDKSEQITVWQNNYIDLPMKKPADGVTPSGATYSYSPGDSSVGDADGDGEYEYFVMWSPSNARDVSQKGYTGNVYIDCYKLNGTLLYRIDLGVNVEAGAHYTQFMVYDFDQDGKAEVIFKTAPGSKTIKYNKDGSIESEKYITMLEEDLKKGYANTDDYRMSTQKFYDHLVGMFMDWQNHDEVKDGRWPKTLEECFGIEVKYTYPLSKDDAQKLADFYIDDLIYKKDAKNRFRDFEGKVLTGPEYLSIFNGETGAEMQTIAYEPGRYDSGLMWGDYAMGRIEPGNRNYRFLAGVGYLDGQKPYAIFSRGYYTRSVIVTYGWDGKELKKYWVVDSGWTPMKNPFKDSPHSIPGTDPVFGKLAGKGAHSLSVADVDNDGFDEIVYGAAVIDHDGKQLSLSPGGAMPKESKVAGQVRGLGHGDALHVADIDPDRPGLEIFMCHEGGAGSPYGYSLRDAKNGVVFAGKYTGKDTGRCMIGDIDPKRRGLEYWAGDPPTTSDETNKKVPGTNANIKWSADLTTQIINGAVKSTPTIDSWEKGKLLEATGTLSNGYTKGNPCIVADVFGDWREELLLRTEDGTAIRIYTSTEVTNHKLYTLMHNAQYRTGVARQNTGYNQPSYTDFYFASDMDWGNVPLLNRPINLENNGAVCLRLDVPKALISNKQVAINPQNENIKPIEMNDRTLVPVRFISEAFNAKVDWDAKLEKVTITTSDKSKIEIMINDNTYLINNEKKTLDVPAQIINDATMLPLRAIAEAMNKNVIWNDEFKIIIITDAKKSVSDNYVSYIEKILK